MYKKMVETNGRDYTETNSRLLQGRNQQRGFREAWRVAEREPG